MRAVSSTYCWVSASSRDGALITKSRNFSNASVCDSSSRSAPRRRHDHPGEQLAPLHRRLGRAVVELLAHIERLGQRRFGVVDGRVNGSVRCVAELVDRQGEFVGAGAHRVVDLDHHRPGQVVEGLQRHRGQRVRVGGVDSPCRGQLGGAPSPARDSA